MTQQLTPFTVHPWKPEKWLLLFFSFVFFSPLKWRPSVAELPVYRLRVPDGHEKSSEESGVRIQGLPVAGGPPADTVGAGSRLRRGGPRNGGWRLVFSTQTWIPSLSFTP